MSDSAPRPNAADEQWDDLLHQWRAEIATPPRPYFYGRVHAKLLHATATKRPPLRTWRHWPAYAVLLGILLLLSGDDAGLQAAGGAPQESGPQSESSFGGE